MIIIVVSNRSKKFAIAHFDKRKNHFIQSGIVLDDNTLSNENIAAVLERFPESPSDDQANSIWMRFQSIKTFTRNEAGPVYSKNRKVAVSGTYSDTDILMEILKTGNCYIML